MTNALSRKLQFHRLAAGLFVLFAMNLAAAVRYVDANGISPSPPFTNWATAATSIQDAVDAAVAGDQVLVTNGVYQIGERASTGQLGISTSRVTVNKALTIKSLNGAPVTLIDGLHKVSCVYLTNGAVLSGFTLTNGAGAYAYGGGVFCESTNALVANCVLTGNSADYGGGGAYGGTLINCVLTANSTYGGGGGALYCTLNNCTLTANSASYQGGGASYCTLNNCILFHNQAPVGANYSGATLSFSCTTPLPTGGVGNISDEPQLASASHLSGGSPCRGAGSAAYATGLDLDGEPWASSPSIGCDEYHPGAVAGPLSLSIRAAYTNVATGFSAAFTAAINGRVTASKWEFDDGSAVTNQPFPSHSWAVAGDYSVVLRAYNDTYPDGISASVTVRVVAQAVHYVVPGNANPVAPYISWATAATNIQDAVDAASLAGALVLVTNGVYDTGGRLVDGVTNRLVVNKPVTVQSLNGAAATLIHGSHTMRCAYLTNGATLAGFTLIDGSAEGGGGVWCESAAAVVSHCVLTGNSAVQGGGAFSGALDHCILSSNSAYSGGGAIRSTLNNCTLRGNSATVGGGAHDSTLDNCALFGNSADYGAGASGGGGNSGYGVASGVALNNCALSGNSASVIGGGAYDCTLNNCTVTGNSAGNEGGGVAGSACNNCVIYYNRAPREANYSRIYVLDGPGLSTLNYCVTTPFPRGGVGNLVVDPQLADLWHLRAGSPCRGAGSATYASGMDMDGDVWANPPSIGCDEYYANAMGPLNVSILGPSTKVAAGFAINFRGTIEGHASANRWDFGDGTTMDNQTPQSYTSHAWARPGDYSLVFKAYNETHPDGVSATSLVQVVEQPVHYVTPNNTSPVAPYATWGTAAANIQDAIDATSVTGALVLVTNGVYQTGERPFFGANRVLVDKPVLVKSVNGAAATAILGSPEYFPGAAIRCVYLAEGAVLTGFTLTNGAASSSGTEMSGGAALCESQASVISDCGLIGNSAYEGGGACGGTLNNCRLADNSAQNGGGASGSALNNCVLTGNYASELGGGALGCMLKNCTLVGNSGNVGGACQSALENCISYYNGGDGGEGAADNYSDSILNFSCTTPLPASGVGDFTIAPLFIDYAGGDLRPKSNSPCINAGSNPLAPAGPDLDGNPRIVGGTVDLGAYEFPAPLSRISYAWLQKYHLPIDGSADDSDPDDDGFNNWREWRAGTNPTNALSALRLLLPVRSGSCIWVRWQSVEGVTYFLERCTNLEAQTVFFPLATNLVGEAGMTTFRDTNAAGVGPFFYRVGVRE